MGEELEACPLLFEVEESLDNIAAVHLLSHNMLGCRLTRLGCARLSLTLYILLAYVPLTVFYLIVFFFKINIHSSQLQGFITYAQCFTIPPLIRILLLSTRHKPVIFLTS